MKQKERNNVYLGYMESKWIGLTEGWSVGCFSSQYPLYFVYGMVHKVVGGLLEASKKIDATTRWKFGRETSD